MDIRDLRKGPVKTVGELEPEDPVFQGLGVELPVGPYGPPLEVPDVHSQHSPLN